MRILLLFILFIIPGILFYRMYTLRYWYEHQCYEEENPTLLQKILEGRYFVSKKPNLESLFVIEWCLLHKSRNSLGISFRFGGSDDYTDSFHIIVPWLFSLYISANIFKKFAKKMFDQKLWDGMDYSLSWMHGSIYWHIHDKSPESWSNKTPKWTQGSFSLTDSILGKLETGRKVLWKKPNYLFKMYPVGLWPYTETEGTVAKETITHKRKRWFTKQYPRFDFEFPEGVVVPAKGEESHNMGDEYGMDRIYSYSFGEDSMGKAEKSLKDGIEKLRKRHSNTDDIFRYYCKN